MNPAIACEHMIDGQLEPNQVLDDKLIDALRSAPRDKFVPDQYVNVAYVDEELKLGDRRFLLAPMVFARMVQLAELQPTDKLLIVGSATGYSAAVLAQLVQHVTALEEQRELADKARRSLSALNVKNVEVVTASLISGCDLHAPYDVIFVEGGIRYIPEALKTQLKDGGRLVAVENIEMRPGDTSGLGRATCWRKQGDTLQARVGFDASVNLLPGFERKAQFEF